MAPENKYEITREKLEELHHEQLKTPSEIAKYFGCSYTLIIHKLKKFGIKKLPKSKRLKGQRFGKLYVEAFSHYNEQKRAIWKTVCDCGNIVYISSGNLRFSRQCLECGRKNRKTHGMSKSELYIIWQGIKSRCSNPNTVNYHNYGGRGITFDPHWEIFENFYNDMGKNFEPGFTIERIDNDKGYYKKNCKWTTIEEQNKNKRCNYYLTYKGKIQIATDWAKELGINRSKIYALREAHPDWSDTQILEKAIKDDSKKFYPKEQIVC